MTESNTGIQVQSDIDIAVPPDEAFALWMAFERFPEFMKHVNEVRPLNGGRYLWRVRGPAGTEVEWEAEITGVIPGKQLGWRSLENSEVDNAGTVTFAANAQGGTHLEVQLAYRPPGGVLGHAVAKLLGADPQREIADDLRRCKDLLEKKQLANEMIG